MESDPTVLNTSWSLLITGIRASIFLFYHRSISKNIDYDFIYGYSFRTTTHVNIF